MKRLFGEKLLLYYGFLPSLALLAFGSILFRSKNPLAVASEILIGAILAAEGVTLTLDFGGYGSAAIARYKQEPVTPLARNMPVFALRFGSGIFLIVVGAIYLNAAMHSLR